MSWWFVVLLASLFATIRNAYVKNANHTLSAQTLSFCRFFLSLLFVFPIFIILFLTQEIQPAWSGDFFVYIACNAVFQVSASILIFKAFRSADFGVVTIFSKAIIPFSLIIGVTFFRETPTIIACIGINLVFAGLLWLHQSNGKISLVSSLRDLVQKSPLRSVLVSAFLLAFAEFFLKQANMLTDTITTTTCMMAANALVLSLIAAPTLWRERIAVRNNVRMLVPFGFFSFLTSITFIYSFRLAYVAYVEAVGQMEVLFAGLFSYFFFKEKALFKHPFPVLVTVTGLLMIVVFH